MLSPDLLIERARELAGGEYGRQTEIYVSGDTILIEHPYGMPIDSKYEKRIVCGRVAYILGVGLTDFPGDSSRDISKPKVVNRESIKNFRLRTNYLLKVTT